MNQTIGRTARVLLLCFGLVFGVVSMAQIDTLGVAPEKDFNDLYKRAAASQFVVVGKVIKTEGIGEHWTQELNDRIKAANDLRVARMGILYVIEAEKTVCRQTEFRVVPSEPLVVPKTIYVFLPKDEPAWVNGQMREEFVTNQRYLLFLIPLEPKIADRWFKIYDLDPHLSYFRGEQLARGVVSLNSDGSGVLDKVTRLCDAMRPPGISEKLSALANLANSGDPVLEHEAQEAEGSLRTEDQQ